jgi:maltose/moltooligosaccharide transporter
LALNPPIHQSSITPQSSILNRHVTLHSSIPPIVNARRQQIFASAIVGLGGLFAGVTGPLLSTFIPPLVRDSLGDHRTAIGLVMAIDNLLLLLLVPWAGSASDRSTARGRGRRPIILTGFMLAAAGMAIFPSSPALGLGGIVASMVALYSGINLQRAPVQALLADVVPSAYRSLATASVTFQMCVGAVVFLMLGRILGMRTAFTIAAITVLVIAAAFAVGVREPSSSSTQAAEPSYGALLSAALTALRGDLPGLRAVFVATILLQLTFQSFTTWYALHAMERFGVRTEDVSVGFIAWAMGGVIGALPAGVIGMRLGRRRAMLLGFAAMALCLGSLSVVGSAGQAVPLLALASACWTLPMVNAYPLFVEPIPREHRGVLAALFLLSMALGGAIGDPLNGAFFDRFDSYRPLFVMMAIYTALAFAVVLRVPRGAGETGDRGGGGDGGNGR